MSFCYTGCIMLTHQEPSSWRAYTVAILAAFLIGSLPTIAALWAQDENHRFNGVLHFGEDMDSYAAFSEQSAAGAWLFHNPAVLSDHSGSYLNPLWLVLGKLIALTGLSFAGLFWLLRFLGLLVLATGFIRLFRLVLTADERNSPRVPWMLFLFLCAQGFGFLGSNPFAVDDSIPSLLASSFPDRYTELFPFFQTTFVPHATLTTGLGFHAVACFFHAVTKGRGYLASGLLLLLLCLIRPYDGLLFLASLLVAVWFCRPKKVFHFHQGNETLSHLLRVGLVFLPALAALAYVGWLTQQSEGFRIWSETNRYPAPGLGLLLGGLGLSFPLGLWGLRALWQRRSETPKGLVALLGMMMFGTLLLMYADDVLGTVIRWFSPRVEVLPFAWRFCATLGSIWLLVALLALLRGTEGLLPGIRRTLHLLVFLGFIAGSAVVLMDKITQAQALSPYDYQPPQWRQAREDLKPLFTESTVLWSHGVYSQKLAGLVGHVVLGHKDLTPDFQARLADYHRFCGLRKESEKARILSRYGVTDLLLGPLDERAGCRVGPGWKAIYRNELFTLYRQVKTGKDATMQ